MWLFKRKTQVGTANEPRATINNEGKNDQPLETEDAATEPETTPADTENPPSDSSKVEKPPARPIPDENTWEAKFANLLFNPCYYCHCWTLQRGCVYLGFLLIVLGAILIVVLLFLPKVAANSDNINEGWLVAANELLQSEDYRISVTVPVSLGSILPGLILILAATVKRRAFLVVYTTCACIGAGIVVIGVIECHSYVVARQPDSGYPSALLPKFKRSKSAISTALWTMGLIDISFLLYSALCSYGLYTQIGDENRKREQALQAIPSGSTLPMDEAQPSGTVMMQGPCPNCHKGYPVSRFTVCGIVLAVLCFPVGLICCFLMRDVRCSVCGAKLAKTKADPMGM